jgi:hypothetical protein
MALFKDNNSKFNEYADAHDALEKRNQAGRYNWATFAAKIEQGLAWGIDPVGLPSIKTDYNSMSDKRVLMYWSTESVLNRPMLASFKYDRTWCKRRSTLDMFVDAILRSDFEYHVYTLDFLDHALALWNKTQELLDETFEQETRKLSNIYV